MTTPFQHDPPDPVNLAHLSKRAWRLMSEIDAALIDGTPDAAVLVKLALVRSYVAQLEAILHSPIDAPVRHLHCCTSCQRPFYLCSKADCSCAPSLCAGCELDTMDAILNTHVMQQNGAVLEVQS